MAGSLVSVGTGIDSAAVTKPSEDENWHVQLALASRFENIELVQLVLEDSLNHADCDEDTRYWVGIAVREAVANAIKHGNRQDPNKRVSVSLALVGEEVVIDIEDEGEGFDPKGVGDPLNTENLLKPNGRGIFYMDKFMDDIRYNFGPPGGTRLTLRKRIERAVAGSEIEEENGMKIGIRQKAGATILDPKGKITIGSGDVALRDSVLEALDSGANKILINLSGVSTIDSSGIGELVAAYTTVTNRGGQLKLSNLSSKVTDILQITQLATVFQVEDEEEIALNNF